MSPSSELKTLRREPCSPINPRMGQEGDQSPQSTEQRSWRRITSSLNGSLLHDSTQKKTKPAQTIQETLPILYQRERLETTSRPIQKTHEVRRSGMGPETTSSKAKPGEFKNYLGANFFITTLLLIDYNFNTYQIFSI